MVLFSGCVRRQNSTADSVINRGQPDIYLSPSDLADWLAASLTSYCILRGLLLSPFNIGYRHVLPILPLLFIFVGQLARIEWRPIQKRAWVAGIAVIWLLVGSLQTAPHYLTFFNELVGGPDRGYRVLLDSNLNWGQELIELRDYLVRENIASVKLSYLGTADPSAYGINYEPLPSFPYHQWRADHIPEMLLNPTNGVYAISASNLQGLNLKSRELYAWFRERKPDAIVGHSIFVYKIGDTIEENITRSDHPQN